NLDVEARALPGALALLLHQARELLLVDLETALGRELLRQLPREAVCVVKPESVLRRDLALSDHLLEQLLAAREGLAEALFLCPDQLGNLAPALVELGVDRAHLPANDVAQLVEERRLEPEASAELDRAADHPAKHVATALVRGRDAFGDQKRGRPRMFNHDAVGLRRPVGGAVGGVCTLADPVEQGLEDVDLRER